MPLRQRELWPAGLVLLGVVLAVALVRPDSRGQRLSNLDVERVGFASTYLVFSRSDPGRCYPVERRAATMRRSDNKQPGRKWHCQRLEGAEAPDTWLIQSKRRGTVVFVPLLEVADWTYPFLYEFVRTRRPELELPWVSWTQLYVDRLYTGLHLRVPLPFDKRKKDGGSGILRELLTARGSELTVLNTRLRAPHGLYAKAVAEGRFPILTPPSPALAWLAQRAPTAGASFLLSEGGLTLLPLPLRLPELFERVHAQPPPRFRDDRYRLWTASVNRAADEAPFSEAEWDRMRAEFEAYAERIRYALQVEAELDASRARLEDEIPIRQAALAGLRLDLGTL